MWPDATLPALLVKRISLKKPRGTVEILENNNSLYTFKYLWLFIARKVDLVWNQGLKQILQHAANKKPQQIADFVGIAEENASGIEDIPIYSSMSMSMTMMQFSVCIGGHRPLWRGYDA